MTIVSFRRRRIRQFRKKVPQHRGIKAKSYIPKRILTFTKGRPSLYKLRQPRQRLFTWKMSDPRQYFRSFMRPYKKPSDRKKDFQAPRSMSKSRSGGKRKSYTSSIGKKKGAGYSGGDMTQKQMWKSKRWADYKKNLVIVSRKSLGKTGLNRQQHFRFGQLATFKYPKKPYSKNSPFVNVSYSLGREGGWGGHRYNAWRAMFRPIVRPKLGPAGPQEPALVFDIRLNRAETQEYLRKILGKGKHLMVLNDIEKALRKAKGRIIEESSKLILSYVPKDTGILRKTIMSSLMRSKVVSTTLRMVMDTGKLKYAKPVNRMETVILAHNMKNKRHSRGWFNELGQFNKNHIHPGFSESGARNAKVSNKVISVRNDERYLHDPKARKGWWNWCTLNTRTVSRKIYDEFISDVQTILTVTIYQNNGMSVPQVHGLAYDELMTKVKYLNWADQITMAGAHSATWLKAHSSKEDMMEMYVKIKEQIDAVMKAKKINYNKPRHVVRETVKREMTMEFNRRYTRGGKNKRVNPNYSPEVAYEFPYLWQSWRNSKEIPTMFEQDFMDAAEGRAKIRHATMKHSDQGELDDQKTIIRTMKLRDWANQRKVVDVITPTRWQVKRLFKVKFK